jgi:excinuclease ABC subunit A
MTKAPMHIDRDGIDQLDPRQYIIIKGARVHNLKNLSVAIPRNRLVVITGLSGSGKSSLAFDTLFAEGQRMYVESLSSYARQFLGRMEKPEVDYIRGVSPAIAIEQRVNTRNPRSTVGTTTEIYDYLKLLYARIGQTFSPVSGQEVRKDTVTDVVDYVLGLEEGTRFAVLCPLRPAGDRSVEQELGILRSKGFTRIQTGVDIHFIDDLLESGGLNEAGEAMILVDRDVVTRGDENVQFRLADSVQTAFFEGHGDCIIEAGGGEGRRFSDRFEADGMRFEEPSVNLFSFNNPYGACRRCEGFGRILGIDPDLVIPDRNLSVYGGAIAPWRSETMRTWLEPLLRNAARMDFPIHRPVRELSPEQERLLWQGNEFFDGIDRFFEHIESKTHKIQYRVMLSRYRGRTVCPECRGTRLRRDAAYVRVGGRSIMDLVLMPVDEVSAFFGALDLDEHRRTVARRILIEIHNRLDYLQRVGLGYLTLNRLSSSLSGGEFQRIQLSTSLGSALVGSMYILDEPSIGLHPRDTRRLISVLERLRDLGNTVIVVEHEEEVMRAADQIIDVGPDAGVHGGELVFQGTIEDAMGNGDTHTTRFLNGTERIAVPAHRRRWKYALQLRGARENNLKQIDVLIPLGVMCAVTGVSGSGKSTLVKRILHPALARLFDQGSDLPGRFDQLEGDVDRLSAVEYVDQNPIGKSSRSNPVTYIKAYDAIRQLYADQPLSKSRGYKPAHFSFNVEGGRCEACQGEGTVKIEMQFMADIYLTCESCGGKRFKEEILEVGVDGKNIADVLDLTVEEAIRFFHNQHALVQKLMPLQDVGLGYIRLGQSSSTLSGGEAQRVKLASFLGKGRQDGPGKTLFIFDEPTTGLHFHDIRILLRAMNALIDQGNSMLIIEHNMEMVKSADWIIDLGPEGGEQGGQVVFAGTPEDMIGQAGSHTARFLREKMPK